MMILFNWFFSLFAMLSGRGVAYGHQGNFRTVPRNKKGGKERFIIIETGFNISTEVST